MTGSQKPEKKSKTDLELLVKHNGGKVVQNDARPGTLCIGDQSRFARPLWIRGANGTQGTVHVASFCKRRNVNIIRSLWLFDNIRQSEADQGRPSLLLPLEPRQDTVSSQMKGITEPKQAYVFCYCGSRTSD